MVITSGLCALTRICNCGRLRLTWGNWHNSTGTSVLCGLLSYGYPIALGILFFGAYAGWLYVGSFGVWLVGLHGHFAVRKASMTGRLYVWVSGVCGLRAFLAFCWMVGTFGMVPTLSGTSDMSACLTRDRKFEFEKDKLCAQFLRLCGHQSMMSDAHRADANRLHNQIKSCCSWIVVKFWYQLVFYIATAGFIKYFFESRTAAK